MADLPVERIVPDLPAFTNVGVDYFGPLEVKKGRGQSEALQQSSLPAWQVGQFISKLLML